MRRTIKRAAETDNGFIPQSDWERARDGGYGARDYMRYAAGINPGPRAAAYERYNKEKKRRELKEDDDTNNDALSLLAGAGGLAGGAWAFSNLRKSLTGDQNKLLTDDNKGFNQARDDYFRELLNDPKSEFRIQHDALRDRDVRKFLDNHKNDNKFKNITADQFLNDDAFKNDRKTILNKVFKENRDVSMSKNKDTWNDYKKNYKENAEAGRAAEGRRNAYRYGATALGAGLGWHGGRMLGNAILGEKEEDEGALSRIARFGLSALGSVGSAYAVNKLPFLRNQAYDNVRAGKSPYSLLSNKPETT